ncbi:MAG TPA: hypothetical protein VH044_17265 [Polyangiaceae bacterium]|jgi:hypothetical protein|nr:hypothetical protein [Polyangiaceae bacterium]
MKTMNAMATLALTGALAGCYLSTPSADQADGGRSSDAAAPSSGNADGGVTPDAAAPFTYNLTSTSAIDVEADAPDGPLAGVLISVRSAPLPGEESGALLWMGVTGPDGHARGETRTEHVDGDVYVTIHKIGWTGPYTDETVRAAEGILAPSGYLVVPMATLSNAVVPLTPRSS